MADFLIYALVAGLSLAIVSGPLGSLVVWRRMAYFGDTLSHAALLGLAIGVMLDIDPTLTIISGCILLTIILLLLQKKNTLASDTLLGILAPSTLSFGLVVISSMPDVQINLMGYLFGDLLAINKEDLILITTGCALILVTLVFIWRPLLSITVHEELASIEGLPVSLLRVVLMLLISIIISVAMKIVGILLITSLLIIPAASARCFSNSPERMALFASFSGILSVCLGLSLSWYRDTPAGPSIVVSAVILFFLSFLFKPSSLDQ